MSPPATATGRALVSFVVECGETKPGEHVRVVGENWELGSWAPENSYVELQTTAAEFPKWRSDWLSLPAGTCEYKFVICGAGGKRPRWESGCNRLLRVPHDVEKGQIVRITVIRAFNRVEAECHLEELPARPPSVTSVASVSKRELPQLPPEVRQRAETALQEAPGLGSRRCASLSLLLVPENRFILDEGEKTPAMRKWNTFSCLPELADGFVPSRRALGRETSDDLVREANHTELASQAPVEVSKVRSQLARGLSNASTTCPGPSPANNQATDSSGQDGSDPASSSDRSDDERPMERTLRRRVERFDECYGLRYRLGEGAFGVVYSCVPHGGNEEFAVKVVQRNRLSAFALAQLMGDESTGKEGEIRLHGSLPTHKNIVGLRDCFEEPWGVRLVMDMCHGGDLFDAIISAKRCRASRGRPGDLALSEQAARNVIHQLLSALSFCHQHGVVHRDLKAENVLLAQPACEVPLESPEAVVKLCDFGLAGRCWSAEPCLTDPVGSPDYIAPEVARMEPYGNGVDVWSAGALLFVCLRGCMPFPARTDQEALELVRKGEPIFDQAWQQVSNGARECIAFLMEVDAAARPSAATALEHSWLNADR